MDDAVLVVCGEAKLLEFGAEVVHQRLFEVAGATGDGLFARLFGSECLHLGIDRGRGVAVVTERDVHGLWREVFPTAKLDVQHRLHTDDLGGRRHEWNPSESFAHDGDFSEDVFKFVFHALLLELVAEVAEHAAGDLVAKGIAIDHFVAVAGELGKFFVFWDEELADFFKLHEIHLRLARVALEHSVHSEAVRLACAIGKWGDGDVDGIDSGTHSCEVSRGTETGSFVGVNPDGDLDFRFESSDDIRGDLWWDESRHVFDDDGGGSHLLKLHTELDEAFDVVHGAGGVADDAVGFFSCFDRCLNGKLHVAWVIQGIEDTEDIHAVFG